MREFRQVGAEASISEVTKGASSQWSVMKRRLTYSIDTEPTQIEVNPTLLSCAIYLRPSLNLVSVLGNQVDL